MFYTGYKKIKIKKIITIVKPLASSLRSESKMVIKICVRNTREFEI